MPPGDPDAHAYLTATYRSSWFFDAKVWRGAALSIVELKEVHRQQDPEFQQLLARVRYGLQEVDDISLLNETGVRPAPRSVLTLASTNKSVERINNSYLAELPSAKRSYVAEVVGKFSEREFPADLELKLKVGARVMLIRNDTSSTPARWANGTLGTIIKLGDDVLHISIDDGHKQKVSREIWDKFRYTYSAREKKLTKDKIGTFTQFPVRLAWATTIHKSQGQSLAEARIELGTGAFAAGQTYVALSRLRTIDGLYLTQPLKNSDIIVDRRVLEFLPRDNDSDHPLWHSFEDEFHKVVKKARSSGISWDIIGGYLGLSGESARRQFE